MECSARDLAQPATCWAAILRAKGLSPISSVTWATSIHFPVLPETMGRRKRNAAVATDANIPPIAAKGRSMMNARRDPCGAEPDDFASCIGKHSPHAVVRKQVFRVFTNVDRFRRRPH